MDDAPTWSVPWQSSRGEAYGLSENLALNNRQAAGPATAADTAKKSGKKKKEATPRNSRGPAFEGADVPDDTFTDGQNATLAVATLGQLAKKKEPFFLAVGFSKPHLPFVAPKKYWDLYDPAKIQLAQNKFRPKDAPDYAIQPGGELRNYHGIPEGSIPGDLARQLKHGYYAAISYVDAQLGRVLDELDRLDLAKNTIVILWGDHGWKLGEHDAWCKHSNAENDTNSPLLLSVPDACTARMEDVYTAMATRMVKVLDKEERMRADLMWLDASLREDHARGVKPLVAAVVARGQAV